MHVQAGGYVIGAGVHLYYICVCMYMYICDPPKSLNGTLAVDSRLALPLHAPETLSSLSKSRIPYLMHTLLYFFTKDDTITVAESHR